MADRRHGDGIDHLLVELRVGFRRRQARSARAGRGSFRSTGLIEGAAGGIGIDDLDVLADRAGLRLRSQGTSMVISLMPAVSNCADQAGIEGKDPQVSRNRFGNEIIPGHTN